MQSFNSEQLSFTGKIKIKFNILLEAFNIMPHKTMQKSSYIFKLTFLIGCLLALIYIKIFAVKIFNIIRDSTACQKTFLELYQRYP